MIDVKKKVLIICGDDVHDIIFMCASKRSQSNLNNILITFLFVFCFCEEKMSVRKSYNHYRIALVVVSLLLLRSSNPRLLSSISAFGMILNHRFTVTQTTTSSYLRLLLRYRVIIIFHVLLVDCQAIPLVKTIVVPLSYQ